MVIIHEPVRVGRAFHRHQLRGGERGGGWLSRPKARRRERQEAQGHAEGAAEGARHRLFSSSYLTGTARVAGLRCRVSPWTETPEHRVQRHVPRGGASLMPPVLGLSRRLGRREGARAPVFLLMRHFVHQCARRMHKTIETMAADTMQGLMRYAW